MWPDQPDFLSIIPEIDPELKQIQKVCHASASVVVSVEEIFSRYSDWKKLKTTIAWLLLNTVVGRNPVVGRVVERSPPSR